MFTNPDLQTIGDQLDKVILRWLVKRGIVPLAKTVHKERMLENIIIIK